MTSFYGIPFVGLISDYLNLFLSLRLLGSDWLRTEMAQELANPDEPVLSTELFHSVRKLGPSKNTSKFSVAKILFLLKIKNGCCFITLLGCSWWRNWPCEIDHPEPATSIECHFTESGKRSNRLHVEFTCASSFWKDFSKCISSGYVH